MHFTEREKKKLLITAAVDFARRHLARRRRARELKLNHRESVARISREVMEGAREMIGAAQVKATLLDGTKLVTIHQPIRG